ncbi:MAG: T9SS type A sorting domain-containing protein [Bacteroidia bacterium]|nr:T9SS type A sorting domain-containing protein [Bacteroidia bacterium]
MSKVFKMIKRNTKLNIAILSVLAVFFMSNRGGSPGGRSGSTSDNGATCSTNGGCHNSSSAPAPQNMISTNVPSNGYAPGSSYDITINVSDGGTSVWGFEMMAEDENGTPVGTFLNNSQVNSLNSGLRVTHKFASSSSSDEQTWVANWTAPASGTGSVTFYVSAMAANGNGNNRGDKVFIDTISIAENTSANIADLENWNINLYPNPTTQKISIDGYTNINSKLKVINQTGKVMMEVNFNNSLDVSALSKGTYYLKIYENDRVFMKRFTKL